MLVPVMVRSGVLRPGSPSMLSPSGSEGFSGVTPAGSGVGLMRICSKQATRIRGVSFCCVDAIAHECCLGVESLSSDCLGMYAWGVMPCHVDAGLLAMQLLHIP